MRWHEHLYVGAKARKKRGRIIRSIRKSRLCPGAYVITPASGENGILDIYPLTMFLQPYYKDRDFLVLGIAADYREALEVARDIVNDIYQETGGFDLSAYLAAIGSKV